MARPSNNWCSTERFVYERIARLRSQRQLMLLADDDEEDDNWLAWLTSALLRPNKWWRPYIQEVSPSRSTTPFIRIVRLASHLPILLLRLPSLIQVQSWNFHQLHRPGNTHRLTSMTSIGGQERDSGSYALARRIYSIRIWVFCESPMNWQTLFNSSSTGPAASFKLVLDFRKCLLLVVAHFYQVIKYTHNHFFATNEQKFPVYLKMYASGRRAKSLRTNVGFEL